MTHNLEVALRHVEAEVDAHDCRGALHAALTAAGAIGHALGEGQEVKAAYAARRLNVATKKLTAWCLVKQ